jgi:hypothetical protein
MALKETHDCDSTADKVSRLSPKLSLWLPSRYYFANFKLRITFSPHVFHSVCFSKKCNPIRRKTMHSNWKKPIKTQGCLMRCSDESSNVAKIFCHFKNRQHHGSSIIFFLAAFTTFESASTGWISQILHYIPPLIQLYWHAGPLPSELDKSTSPQWINPQNNAHTKMEKSKSATVTKRLHITDKLNRILALTEQFAGIYCPRPSVLTGHYL